jgi:hypothetical protein
MTTCDLLAEYESEKEKIGFAAAAMENFAGHPRQTVCQKLCARQSPA